MKKFAFLSLTLVVLLAACAPKATPAATQGVPITGGDQGSSGSVQNPPAVVPSETATTQFVTAMANINLNCRFGPNTIFDLVVVINQGQSATVIGRNSDTGLWYKLQTSDGKECWADSANLTLTGDVTTVAHLSSPPTPTPVPPTYYWLGTWTSYQNAYITNNAANETVTPVTFVATGPNTIQGTYVAFGCTSIVATLTVSSDGVYANGTTRYYGACGGSNEVHLTMLSNHNQFRGKVNVTGSSSTDWYFAGSRNGFAAPSPRR
jgi:hypothetical protein